MVLTQQMGTQILLVQLVQVDMPALKKACLKAIFTNVQLDTSAQLGQPALNLKKLQEFLAMIRISATRLCINFQTI